ncbi:MAG: 7-cyano-7-deazaguanine synthase QueC [Lachnospiraceae bacterium]|nr:7-cyano-7-deazaguanine synthase QueC [Lachnospiraceae bacterium]
MKALVLVSGGLDSATALAEAIEAYGAKECFALSVFYGQKHQKELEAARELCAYYQVELMELNLSTLFEQSNCSLLQWSDEEIPHTSYAEQQKDAENTPVSTYVPFRNGLFLSSAASLALSRGCEVIYYGIHSDDAAGNAYPDTSDAFNKAISDAIRIGSGCQLKVVAPFVKKNKAEVVKEGLRLKVPYEKTWSCYEGRDRACGVCGTCIDRRRAFLANGVTDPVPYEEEDM